MLGTSNVTRILRRVGRAQQSSSPSTHSSFSYKNYLLKPVQNHHQHQYRPLFSSSSSSSSSSGFPFKPPPIRQRLKPLIPFFIYWSLITSLAVHLLRLRIQTQEEMDKRRAQISVLTNLVERIQNGDDSLLKEDDMRRELEMVGLRERSALTLSQGEELGVTADVGWKEVFFGKKMKMTMNQEEQAEKDAEIIQQWAQVVNQATDTHTPSTPIAPNPTPDRSTTSSVPVPVREAKRAPSANVYM